MPPVESAADLAGMFNTGDFAVAGTYTPVAGGPVTVAVILDTPDDAAGGLGTIGAQAGQVTARIRTAQLPGGTAGRGDALVIGAATYTVASAQIDLTGAMWRLVLAD